MKFLKKSQKQKFVSHIHWSDPPASQLFLLYILSLSTKHGLPAHKFPQPPPPPSTSPKARGTVVIPLLGVSV